MNHHKRSKIVQLLSRFTYVQKFVFISFLFIVSLLIAGYYMIKAQNTAIYFAEQELKGNIYERGLRKLMETLPKHEWIANQLILGNKETKEDLENLSAEISADFKYLSQIDKELEEDLGTRPADLVNRNVPPVKPIELAEKWNALIKRISNLSPEENVELHEEILDNINKLLLHVGETANLVLDPSVEANYFMDTILFELPQAQMLIPKMVTLEQSLLKKKEITKKDREAMMVLISFLQANIDVTKNVLQKGFALARSVRKDDTVEAKLKVPLFQYLDSTSALIKYTQENILSGEHKGNEAEYLSLAGKALDDSFSLWDATIDEFDSMLATRIDEFKRQQYVSLAAALLFAILGIVLGILIMQEISRPLTDLVIAAKRFAQGDLSTRVPVVYHDEVGQVGIAFNQMAESFKHLIDKLQSTGEQLTKSTKEISAAAKEQEATVIQQESTTKEISQTAQEISSTSKELARTMNDINAASEQTSLFASSGKQGLTRMESIMRQMVDASQNIATKLAVLSEKAGNITSIITTITKVADQTNLLSLNAAIEAEKAGEHGRTFAVIAREIRRLADQTGNATHDIEQTVNEIVSAVAAGVMSVDKFSEEIHTGVKQANSVSEQLSKIIEQVQQQTVTFESVNKGMQTQSIGAEQINESISQLTEVAQHASASIRQFHSAVEQLTDMTHEMEETVSNIKR